MDEWITLYTVALTGKHSSKSKTRHVVYGTEMPRPVELRVVKCSGDKGLYLYYCDETGKEMSDTYHDSVEAAMDQAKFEFGIESSEWHPASA